MKVRLIERRVCEMATELCYAVAFFLFAKGMPRSLQCQQEFYS